MELHRNGWVGPANRMVSLDFTLYSADVNMFLFYRAIFEMPATGGIIPSDIISAFSRHTAEFFWLLTAWVTFVLYFATEEVIQIKKQKWEYLSDFWNIIDWLNIFSSLFSILCLVVEYEMTPLDYQSASFSLDVTSAAAQRKYYDFSNTAILTRMNFWAIATNAAVSWIKVTKYSDQFWSRVGIINISIRVARWDVLAYMFVFIIMGISFLLCLQMIFAKDSSAFRSGGRAAATLFDAMLGNINLVELYRFDFVGAIVYALFIVFTVFIFMTTFIAIIDTAFKRAKDLVNSHEAQRKQIVQYRQKEAKEQRKKEKRQQRNIRKGHKKHAKGTAVENDVPMRTGHSETAHVPHKKRQKSDPVMVSSNPLNARFSGASDCTEDNAPLTSGAHRDSLVTADSVARFRLGSVISVGSDLPTPPSTPGESPALGPAPVPDDDVPYMLGPAPVPDDDILRMTVVTQSESSGVTASHSVTSSPKLSAAEAREIAQESELESLLVLKQQFGTHVLQSKAYLDEYAHFVRDMQAA